VTYAVLLLRSATTLLILKETVLPVSQALFTTPTLITVLGKLTQFFVTLLHLRFQTRCRSKKDRYSQGLLLPLAWRSSSTSTYPRPPALPNSSGSIILIRGASSLVESATVQIASAIGLNVWATASPSNHEFVKSIGASEVFDYHSPNVISKSLTAAKKLGVTITKVLDSVSETGSLKLASDVLVKGGNGGDMATVLQWPAETPKPESISVSLTLAMRTGQDCSELGAWFFNEWLEKALKRGTVVPAPKTQLVEGAIGGTQKVFDILKAGVSATKLVVEV
jgi:hypothetical protein